VIGKRDEAAGRTEIKTGLPPTMQILTSRFDNLKDGLPAIVRAPLREKVGDQEKTQAAS
jgi:hypothetical protein